MAIEILNVAHCNVNCSNLTRSLAFYRDLVGLQPGIHTNPAPQDSASGRAIFLMVSQKAEYQPDLVAECIAIAST